MMALKEKVEDKVSCESNSYCRSLGKLDTAKEKHMKKIEAKLSDKAPATVRFWFPFCGGPVPTLEMCGFAIPMDQKDEVQTDIKVYKELRDKDVGWGKSVGVAQPPLAMSLSATIGAPTSALVPPGNCVLKADAWTPVALVDRTTLTHDTVLLTFKLPDCSRPLDLSTCACVLAMFQEDVGSDPVIRPYTPVSTNALVGHFQLTVKVYLDGKMSQHMAKLPIGDAINFKHIPKNVKMQYPFGKKNITMLAGGTGIAPMIQALHALLGTEGDDTKVVLLLGNKTQNDIVAKDLLDDWGSKFPDRLKVVHVLSRADDDKTWAGETGHISQSLIEKFCAPPSENSHVFVCGPPPMYDALCGPRENSDELSGLLANMGYVIEQVYKF